MSSRGFDVHFFLSLNLTNLPIERRTFIHERDDLKEKNFLYILLPTFDGTVGVEERLMCFEENHQIEINNGFSLFPAFKVLFLSLRSIKVHMAHSPLN